MSKIRITDIAKKYRRGERLTMLTAYDATIARLVDEAGVDMILVGDSLGMVVQGHESTIPVTLDEVIYHTRCASRGASRALVVADLPFMSYQASTTQAMLAAGRAMKEGAAGAVKLEGGLEMAKAVSLMTAAGIPVMAHIGLRPQRIHAMGGYKIQGRTAEDASLLVEEARSFERAGAFSLVLEGVAMETAKEITGSVGIPTIGIGCGPHCAGQVLVIYDMLGLNPTFSPTFLKVYADGHSVINSAVKDYIEDVRAGRFPTESHGFKRR
ncbi:MAG: 3-methyl-2-oxobutanoate hydroxymethyltransferase [Proteobacteria bacterium]|nr:3-methyl-2-oxobutanoate hydroxymethyltransferase [Pseudomonadota bacterium]